MPVHPPPGVFCWRSSLLASISFSSCFQNSTPSFLFSGESSGAPATPAGAWTPSLRAQVPELNAAHGAAAPAAARRTPLQAPFAPFPGGDREHSLRRRLAVTNLILSRFSQSTFNRKAVYEMPGRSSPGCPSLCDGGFLLHSVGVSLVISVTAAARSQRIGRFVSP